MLVKNFFSVLILLLCANLAQAGPSPVHFIIKFENNVNPKDSLRVRFFKDFITHTGSENCIEQFIHPDKNHEYRFSLPAIDKLARMGISGCAQDMLLSDQLVEPGDSVKMIFVLDKNRFVRTARYSGHGAAKYALIEQVAYGKRLSTSLSYPKDPTDYAAIYLRAFKLEKECVQRVYQFKGDVSPVIRRVLALDVTGDIRSWALGCCVTGMTPLSAENFEKRKKGWLQLLDYRDTANADDAALSSSYCEFLYLREQLRLFYLATGESPEKFFNIPVGFGFQQMQDTLLKNYSGKTIERLITRQLVSASEITMVYRGVDPQEYFDCLQTGLSVVQNPVFRQLIKDRLNTSAKGAPAFDFAFEDTTGKIIKLVDLKGKVVMLDIWSNPCGGCGKFKADFEKEVYPFVKDNPDFQVVSINLNKGKKYWLSGIDAYSDQKFTNVWVGSEGFNHPIVEHYKVDGVPRIILIDKSGKLISATVPTFRSMDKLLKMIQDALASDVSDESKM